MKTVGKVENIAYTLLYRKGSRHITIRVRADGIVKVSCPYGISKAAVERVILNNKQKVLDTIAQQQKYLHTFGDGELFLYEGQEYSLSLVRGNRNRIFLEDDQLVIQYTKESADPLVVCAMIKDLYREQVRSRVIPLLAYWSEQLQVPVPPYSVRDSKTRWGSCSAKGRLNFSLRCQVLDEQQLSYIVLHEMAHLLVFNHSAVFHALLYKHMPTYKIVQKSIFSLQRKSQLCL